MFSRRLAQFVKTRTNLIKATIKILCSKAVLKEKRISVFLLDPPELVHVLFAQSSTSPIKINYQVY